MRALRGWTVRSAIASAVVSISPTIGCAAVPYISFPDDAGSDATSVDASFIDASPSDDAAAEASHDAAPTPVCPTPTPPAGVMCCMNGMACAGVQCNPGTCGKCAQKPCAPSQVCCSRGGGVLDCIAPGDPC